jgi:hypothetical protein
MMPKERHAPWSLCNSRRFTLVIIATWEADIGRIMIQGQSRQHKICKVPSQLNGKIAGHGSTHLSSQQCQEAKNRIISIQAGLYKKQDPISMIIRAERA